ncbi:MAG: beta-lactamase superfamily domain protein [Firmicutes bacterium]|nr:beta-lactamase superfamily domain protein [Bacillota bacterium]
MTKILFLGTSDSKGVPRLMCNCKVCQSQDAKNNRKRSSLLIKGEASTQLLIDISPDFKTQYMNISKSIDHIPDVLVTHAHYDHIGGLGDFADMSFCNHGNVSLISPPDIIEMIVNRNPYLKNRDGLTFISEYCWKFDQWMINFHKVNHGNNGYSYGIIFQKNNYKWGYFSDAINLSPQELEPMYDCDLLILGTNYWDESEGSDRSVHDVQEGLALKEKLRVKTMVLTHLSHEIEYYYHSALLPDNVQFAFDGMEFEID